MGDDQVFTVSLSILNQNQQDLELRAKHQNLTLHLREEPEHISISIHDAGGTSILEFFITRTSECCRVSTRSFLITLRSVSVFLNFTSASEFQSFFTRLRSWRASRRVTEPFSAHQLQPASLSKHKDLLQDFLKIATFQKAMLLNAVDFTDKVVLDVGCGTGILSFFAVQAGAKKVFAVEASSASGYAETLVRSNHMSEKITVLCGETDEVCPAEVDVIISQPMSFMLLHERWMERFLHAKHWLKPQGMIFPTQSDIHLAPFSDQQLYIEHQERSSFWKQELFYGVNLTGLHAPALAELFTQPIMDTFDVEILMARSVKHSINFQETTAEDLHRLKIPFVFHILQSGLIHGLAFWFDVAFMGSRTTVWISTAPEEPITYCLLQTPLFAKSGQTLSGHVLLTNNQSQTYDIHITAVVDQSGFASANQLDLKKTLLR